MEPEVLSEVGGVEGVGVDEAAVPLEPFATFGVGGVGQDVEEFAVTPWSAAVFGWTGSPPADAARHGRDVVGGERRFDGDVVDPVVTEVVGVADLVVAVADRLVDADASSRAG